MTPIGFNKPYLSGKEMEYIQDAVVSKKISGNGKYTNLCHQFFQNRYGFKKCLLTTSCTDALEMCAILLDIKPGDEVIVPSFTFVSTANAFVLRGAKIVFADSHESHPNIDTDQIEPLITKKTKAIAVVHYAGVACDMDKIMTLAEKHNLFVVEDAAQAIDSFYKGRPLGSIGHMAAFSFHETKNIISGEGGMLVINDERFEKRAEIIWEKGTNRAAFFKGEVDKYSWVDIGSSFLPSEIIAAFLYAQLENIETIQQKRKSIWNYYYEEFKELDEKANIRRPTIPAFATNNGHMFYLQCESETVRSKLINYLKAKHIHAVFHYLSLHQSQFHASFHDGRSLPNADRFSKTLVRMPFYMELLAADQDVIIKHCSISLLAN